MQELTLKDYAGQNNDVVITQSDNKSIYVTFRSKPGYGYPLLELEEIENLLVRIKKIYATTF